MRKVITALFLLLFFPTLKGNAQDSSIFLGGGTSIVTLISEDSIWMAADSKLSPVFGTTNKIPTTTDKIFCRNNILFSFSGEPSVIGKRDKVIFDINNFMIKCIDNNKNFENSISEFNSTFPTAFDNVIKGIPKKISLPIRSRINEKTFQLTIVTFGNGRPIYRFENFGYFLHGKDTVFNYVDVTDYKTHLPLFHYTGISDEMRIAKKTISHGNVPKLLSDLIRIEIRQHSDKVGEPVKVIVLTKAGCKWLPSN